MSSLVVLAILGALIWFWIDSLRARELALATGARACAEIQTQFLDQSVSVARLRLARNSQGRLVFRRTFSFEFSDNGADRRHGEIVVLGRRVQSVVLENPEGGSIITAADR